MLSKSLRSAGLPPLPKRFSLCDSNWVTSVKNQNPYGACWAFAAIASVEASVLRREGVELDLSENNLITGHGYDWGFNEGGNGNMAMAYFLRWGGPILEGEDPYPNSSARITRAPSRHVQRVIRLPPRCSSVDNETIKRVLVEYGAVMASYCDLDGYQGYAESYNKVTGAYYCNKSYAHNHAITLVGWDDDYPAGNFVTRPPHNGAFIVKNSWGSDFGDSGYIYISYYDANLGTQEDMHAFVGVDSVSNYGMVYQYDDFGEVSHIGYESSTGWGANVFVAAKDEIVEAVGFYADAPNTGYKVEVYSGVDDVDPRSGTLMASVSGTCEFAGFDTVKLSSPVNIAKDVRFSVVVRVVSPGELYPIAIEENISRRTGFNYDYSSSAVAHPGESFINDNPDKWAWEDVSAEGMNCCIKAYTRYGQAAPLVVTSQVLANAEQNRHYSSTLIVSGGTPPYIWSLEGKLPEGLSFDSHGIISGTPLETGKFTFGVSIVDVDGERVITANDAFSLTVDLAMVFEGDNFDSPLNIVGASGSHYIEKFDRYTLEPGEPRHTEYYTETVYGYKFEYASAWFKWTAPSAGMVTFTSGSMIEGYRYPTFLALYSGDELSGIRRLAYSYDCQTNGDYTTSCSLEVEKGKTYRIAVVQGGPNAAVFGASLSLVWTMVGASPVSVWVDGVENVRECGDEVHFTASPSVTNGGESVTCCGWVGTGDVPATGNGNEVSFIVRQESSLRWLYATNYLVSALATEGGQAVVEQMPGGVCTDKELWVLAGDSLTLKAMADEGYGFVRWVDVETGRSCGVGESMVLSVDCPRSVKAEFMKLGQLGFMSPSLQVEEAQQIALRVVGGNIGEDASVEVHLSYQTAAAADLDLTKGMIDGVVPKGGLKFPLTISWKAGDVGSRLITIPVKADKNIEDDEVLIFQLAAERGMPLGAVRECRVTICDVNVAADYDEKQNKGTTKTKNGIADNYDLKVVCAANDGSNEICGYTTGQGRYYNGCNASLKAAARPGWEFKAWGEVVDGCTNIVGDKAAWSVQVVRETEMIAFFWRIPYMTGLALPANGGKVSGSGYCATGKKVTLKATANKGYVFAGWFADSAFSEPYDGTVDYRTPSLPLSMVANDVLLYAKFIPVAEDWATVGCEIENEYVTKQAIEPISVVADGASLPTVKATGLPAGLKFTDKLVTSKVTTGTGKDRVTILVTNALPNQIYGTPTKSGIFNAKVTVTTAGKATASTNLVFTVLDRANGERILRVEYDSSAGKTTGAGIYAAGKKVTLKATANAAKKATKTTLAQDATVFAGWYADLNCEEPLVGEVDFRTLSFPYVMPDVDATVWADFVPASEDADIVLVLGGHEVTPVAAETVFNTAGELTLVLNAKSVTVPKISVSGLPAGLKFTEKQILNKDKTILAGANTIYGTATKPGTYVVTAKLTNTTVKKAIERKFTIVVDNLTGANGSFREQIANARGEKYDLSVGVANLSVLPSLALANPNAKLSVSGLPSGLKYNAQSGVIEGVATKAGTYTVYLTVTEGKVKTVSTVTIDVAALPAWLVGSYEGIGEYSSYGFTDSREDNLLGMLTISSVGKLSGKFTLDVGLEKKNPVATCSLAALNRKEGVGDDAVYFATISLVFKAFGETRTLLREIRLSARPIGDSGLLGGRAVMDYDEVWFDLGQNLYGRKDFAAPVFASKTVEVSKTLEIHGDLECSGTSTLTATIGPKGSINFVLVDKVHDSEEAWTEQGKAKGTLIITGYDVAAGTYTAESAFVLDDGGTCYVAFSLNTDAQGRIISEGSEVVDCTDFANWSY